MEQMRINKYLSSIGIASRREIDKMVEAKRIKVNGILATTGLQVSEKDKIEIDGKILEKKDTEKVYFILNKPKNVLSSAKDDRNRKTVVDLIKCNERIFPIGRLDYDTEGLILLTNDGELFNRVIHPKAEIFKEYVAVVQGEVTEHEVMRLSRGILLDDGPTLPAKVKLLSKEKNRSEISISIREGRNRQIRRMLKAIDHPVIFLKRVAVGKITLGDLKVGGYRKLTAQELKYLQSI